MVVICKPEDSEDWYNKMWNYSVELFRTLDIPVRKQWVDGPAIEDVNLHLYVHKFDLETVKEEDITDEYVKSKETDGFWHLNYQGERLSKGHTPSKAWLKENVDFAYFDESLWILLQNKVWRMKLRDYIIEHKLTDGFWSGKFAAESFGIIATLLFVA